MLGPRQQSASLGDIGTDTSKYRQAVKTNKCANQKSPNTTDYNVISELVRPWEFSGTGSDRSAEATRRY